MASPFASSVLPGRGRDDDEPRLPALSVDLTSDTPQTTVKDGAAVTELPDGSLSVDLSGRASPPVDNLDAPFHANLAEKMEEGELQKLASDLLEGIDRDEQSRTEHLRMLSEGIQILGLVIETLTTTSVTSSAPLEGMSTVRHPLLLDACALFQATAKGELLPAAGPVKVRDDRPREPDSMKQADALAKSMMGHNGGPSLQDAGNPFASAQGNNAPTPAAAPSAAGASAPGAGSSPPPAGAGGHPMPPPAMPPQGMPNVPGPAQPGPMAVAANAAAGAGNGPMPQPGSAPGAAPAPQPPPQMPSPPLQPTDEEEERDAVEEALEKDFNHYLTVIDRGYVPDTDQMLFKIGFGGLGIKKIYHDPLKRRPVSRSVNIEDFIVSKDVSDLEDAERITQRIRMPRATMRRMQVVGAYRDIDLGEPTMASDAANQVKQTKEEISGVRQSTDPRDIDYEVFECYCLRDMDQFAPRRFKGKRLPLPYKVSIERYTQKVLEVRRNWREDDDECQPKQWFVDFVYMRAFGFYCIGLLHLLGNTTKALTALWREFIDSGMFANFPGFLFLKGAGRQLTNQFRVAPGSGIGIDASVEDIRQAIMPLPYKSPDAAFAQFVQHVEELGQKLGGTANTPVAEGRADAPVGTTMALIEQSSKPVGAVLGRLHSSMDREFQLLKERFREDPEAFWRFNRRPAMKWEKDIFIKALEDFEVVPVSDPNNPTKLHRMGKAEAYRQIVMGAPMAFDPKKAILKYCTEVGIDGVEDTLAANISQINQPQQAPVDQAKLAQVAQQHAKAQMDQQTQQQKIQSDMAKQAMTAKDKAADRQNKLAVASVNQDTERLRLASTVAIHASDLNAAEEAAHLNVASDHASQAHQHMNEMEMQGQAARQQAQAAQQASQATMAEGGVAAARTEFAAQSDHNRAMQMQAAEAARSEQQSGRDWQRQEIGAARSDQRQRQGEREQSMFERQGEREQAMRERQDADTAFQRQSQEAEKAHQRAKDMATHTAKVNPKPAPAGSKPRPKKGK